MRTTTAALLLAAFLCCTLAVQACEPDQYHNGCKISGTSCECGNGCRNVYVYRTRRDCLNAVKEKSSNVCYQMPCVRGICIQTSQDPGFACKCEGTGFYGRRCERACPTIPMRGVVFPHECIVI